MIRQIGFALVICLVVSPNVSAQTSEREFYKLTFYNFQTGQQEAILDSYLSKALVPALHRSGIQTVGVFKPIANDTSAVKCIVMLHAIKSLNQLATLHNALKKDIKYKSGAEAFMQWDGKNPAYLRQEAVVLSQFAMAPKLQLPVLKSLRADRVYELRSYESASEKLHHNKVHMFNEGDEIGLFKKLNFNAVFYGEVLAGSKMPNLMYMTSFENMAERDAHWKAFVASEEWKKLVANEYYKGNVSHIDIWLMRPTSYSDF